MMMMMMMILMIITIIIMIIMIIKDEKPMAIKRHGPHHKEN
jgi:hypothetical protein